MKKGREIDRKKDFEILRGKTGAGTGVWEWGK